MSKYDHQSQSRPRAIATALAVAVAMASAPSFAVPSRAGSSHADSETMDTLLSKIDADVARLKSAWRARTIGVAGLKAGVTGIAAKLEHLALRAAGGPSAGATIRATPTVKTIKPADPNAVPTYERERIFEKRQNETLSTHLPDTRTGDEKANASAPNLGAAGAAYLASLEHACAELMRGLSRDAAAGALDSLVEALPQRR